MMSAVDLYALLGVGRDATPEEIKKAYRALARELHPDASGDPSTEERFKEVTAAYEILSDPAKRERYDRFGSSGGPGVSPFGDVADLFEAFFGAGSFGQRRPQRRSRSQRGEDLFARVDLTFEEAAFGTHRDIRLERLQPCAACGGVGAAPGTSASRCAGCGGVGQVQDVRQSIFGTVMTSTPCRRCEGTGEEILDRCQTCRGRGREGATVTVPVDVPAGVTDGLEIRMAGQGHAGRAGASSGDLYLSLHVAPHPLFERRGQDLFAALEVPMVTAALGGEVTVATLDGSERVHIESGTQPGDVIRLKGCGVASVGRRGRGDLFLTLTVAIPRRLGRDERALLERFAGGRTEDAPRLLGPEER